MECFRIVTFIELVPIGLIFIRLGYVLPLPFLNLGIIVMFLPFIYMFLLFIAYVINELYLSVKETTLPVTCQPTQVSFAATSQAQNQLIHCQ